jgi:hypothetical protein
MKPWPKQEDHMTGAYVSESRAARWTDASRPDAASYERARADAAMERLRLAVEALKRVGSYSIALGDGPSVATMHAIHGCLEESAKTAIETLEAIGEVP